MNVALDTNGYSDFMRGVVERVAIVRAAQAIFLPFIVLGELRAGFAAGDRQSVNAANLQRFLASPRVSVLLADEQTTTTTRSCIGSFAAREARYRRTTSGSRPWWCSTTWCSARPTATFVRFRSS